MTKPYPALSIAPPISRTPAPTDVGVVLQALRRLVESSEPAVVFTSLATISTEVLSDECRVYLQEEDLSSYLICRPAAVVDVDLDSGDPLDDYLVFELAEHTISTPVEVGATDGRPGYRGVVVHRWHAPYRPTASDSALARVAVDQAVALVGRQRLAERAVHLEAQTAHLQTALASNRTIGAAMGILMITQHISEPDAFNLLRTTSQNTHRKLRDVAGDVVFTGTL